MAVTLTQAQLSAAVRLGDSTEEVAEATRLLAYVTEAIARHLGDAYEAAPETTVNEAAIRLAGYLFDQPNAGRGLSFANAGRNSGAWAILLPFRVHRAGTTGEAVAAAQEAVGSTVNPVVDVTTDAVAGTLTITFADGTSRDETLPAGMGSGADQTARDAAAAAQSEINAHELTLHNTDTVARSTAANARQVGEAAQATADAVRTELATHETTPHGGGGGTDQTARDAAATAQGAIDTHERAPHNTDQTARTAASAAQDRADNAFVLADGKVDPAGAAAAAREITSDWAEAENIDPIPAPKLVNVVNAHEDIVSVLDGRLPGLPVAMRLGWSQTRTFTELDFDRPLPPVGGSIAGMSDGLPAPPFPPGLASDPTLFFGVWLAGDPDVVEISGGGAQFGGKRPLSINTGKVGGEPGHYVVSTARLRPLEGTIFSVTIAGPLLVLESDLAAHTSDPDAHHVPPTGSTGGAPTVLYEAQTAAIGSSSGLIAGNVVCPATGEIEVYADQVTGTRQGAVAYARIPAARIRGAVSALNAAYSNDSANLLAIPHGAKTRCRRGGTGDLQLFDVERASAGELLHSHTPCPHLIDESSCGALSRRATSLASPRKP